MEVSLRYHTRAMKILSIFLIGVLLGFGGCARWGMSPSTEPVVDSELASSIPSSSGPRSDPGEPQRGFDQEQLQSQQV